MTVKSDKWIERMALECGMISPFEAEQVRQTDGKPGAVTVSPIGVISYGLSSFGYDMRVADEYKVFVDNRVGGIVDPKNFDPHNFMEVRDKGSCIIPPNSFALGYSVERFKIPKDVLALVIGKSTYARCGIVVNCTPMEPEWEGHLTIEISNTTPLPARIWSNEGIAVAVFYQSDEDCRMSYKDKKGKYQGQKAEIVLPKL